MTHEDIATLVKTNLADVRMYAIQLFIENLLERRNYPDGVPRYRLTDLNTGQPIVDIAGFINAVTGSSIKTSYPYNGDGLQTDRITGFFVTLTNIEVQFLQYSESDLFFSQYYDFTNDNRNKYHISFYMGYVNDSDTQLPLKTQYVRLQLK